MAPISKSARHPRELKKVRLELRVAASAKDVIQRAGAISGLTPGELAYEGARRVLEEHERMILTAHDRDIFVAALLHPPKPSNKLQEAFRRHRQLVG